VLEISGIARNIYDILSAGVIDVRGYALIAALAYIEDNLTEDIKLSDVAEACYYSTTGIQRIFTTVFGYSLKEYVIKRRLSKAARELTMGASSVTEIAFRYTYGSLEAFSRAFSRVYNETPSNYRRMSRNTELFPPLTVEYEEEGMVLMKKVDISAFYDYLQSIRGSYMLCVDIVGFEKINLDYGYAAGDAILAEVAKRIERHLLSEMMCIRIGGDEFLVLTGYENHDDARGLADRIISENGNDVDVQGHTIALSVRIAVTELPDKTDLFRQLIEKFDHAVEVKRELGKR